jgi:hypothetical protein
LERCGVTELASIASSASYMTTASMIKVNAMESVWDGIVQSAVLGDSNTRVRQDLADSAKRYNWKSVYSILGDHHDLVNTSRPDGSSLYAPLHQAAHGGALVEVVETLVRMGAWRTLQNARGERAVDIAEKKGHSHLIEVLNPKMKRSVPFGILLKIQVHFHNVIRGRADEFVTKHGLRLPELEPSLEYDRVKFWFAIPGMYGGFAYWLESDGVEAKIVTESWCRVAEGSGQRHEITSAGSKLVAEGFV